MKLSEKGRARIGGIIAMLMMVAFVVYQDRKAQKMWDVQFEVFDSSNLSGRISYLRSRGGVTFQLNGAYETYLFVPEITPPRDDISFADIAETEDSIYKPALADTLILVKVRTKKKYKFTFRPPG